MNKKIDRENLADIGFVKKTHGVNGEVLVNCADGFEELLEELEYVFVEIDGLPVPFFIESISSRGGNAYNVHFETLIDQAKAKELVGCRMFCEQEYVPENEEGIFLSMLVGYILMEKSMGQIGEIVAVDDFGGNLVLTVTRNDGEVMVPVNEELIVNIDRENKVLIMDLPSGLFDL